MAYSHQCKFIHKIAPKWREGENKRKEQLNLPMIQYTGSWYMLFYYWLLIIYVILQVYNFLFNCNNKIINIEYSIIIAGNSKWWNSSE